VNVVGRRLRDAALARAIALARPAAQTTWGAGALRAGIDYEALLRAQHRLSSGAVSNITGRQTQQQRWAHAEHQARRSAAPGRPVGGPGRPAVFWHGPDRIAPDRPVIVLVNGWTASGVVWPAGMIEQLESTHQVVRIDNRGSGLSRTALAPFTIARMADDVADVMGAIGATSAAVVGLSMGGMIAQETALRHPALVTRLVLCGTRPPPPAGFLPAPSSLDAIMSGPRPAEPLHDYFLRSWGTVVGPGFAQSHPQEMAELIDRIAQRTTPQAGVMAQLRAISSWHGSHRLTRIAAPTTVIHGSDDPLIPVGNGMRLAQLIRGARYIELPGVGHIVPFEAPDAVIQAIVEG
jgi:3-oxoadipate enol-lactonase